MRVVYIVKLKLYMIFTHIFDIIIYKFHNKLKFYQVILFSIDNSLKIKFYYIVLSLDLVIYLGIKNYEKLFFYTQEVIQEQSEF